MADDSDYLFSEFMISPRRSLNQTEQILFVAETLFPYPDGPHPDRLEAARERMRRNGPAKIDYFKLDPEQ